MSVFGVAFGESNLEQRDDLNFAGTRLQRWFYTSQVVPSSRVDPLGVGLFGNAAQSGW
jgi:hypothetical protein